MVNGRLKLVIQILVITACASLTESIFAREIIADDEMPNVVLILTDDLGYGDVSCLNPDSKIKTHHLDELAREGLLFTDAHAPSTICSPTRYALLTGRYAWRGVLKAGVLKPWDDPAIEPERLTLARMLKEKGYHTACIGKWHLGFHWPWQDGVKPPRDNILNRGTSIAGVDMFDFNQAIHGGPLAAGFDYYFGDDVPNFPPYAFIENEHFTCTPIDMNPDDFVSIGYRGYIHGVGPGQEGWKLDQVMPGITSKAVEYIHQQKKSESPFFLYFATTSPHTPVVPTDEFQGKSDAGYYGDYVQQTDDAIGRVLEALKRTAQFDNTLVIVSSDNGPEGFTYDLINNYSHYSMGQMRGIKRDTWEGGHRVPLVISWPDGNIGRGYSNALISLTDIFATLAAITDYKLPQNSAEDSFNMRSDLQGGGSTRESMIYHNGKGHLALREGDWVYIRKSGAGRPEPEWFRQKHGVIQDDAPNELFNLENDPGEKLNLYNQFPEKAARMESRLQKMIEAGGTRNLELGN
ncbi:MAG: arylsulfatase [Bacteroidetes bacterium]|nr:arylsulfatase [Bacteroidota bacterium]